MTIKKYDDLQELLFLLKYKVVEEGRGYIQLSHGHVVWTYGTEMVFGMGYTQYLVSAKLLARFKEAHKSAMQFNNTLDDLLNK